jgi:hypothetical protein
MSDIKEFIAKTYGVVWANKTQLENLEQFAALVRADERDACIKACEQVTADLRNYASAFEGITAETKFIRNIGAVVGEPFIEAIRARGQE